MAVRSGPSGPVLAGPIILKVSNDHIVVTRKLNLFLRKSIKLLPQELLLLAQICTKSFVGWGFAPDPIGGAYSAPPDPLTGLGGGAPGEREGGTGGERREEREGGEGREGRGVKGREGVPECPNPLLASLVAGPSTWNALSAPLRNDELSACLVISSPAED